jgi:hypothetical protein
MTEITPSRRALTEPAVEHATLLERAFANKPE